MHFRGRLKSFTEKYQISHRLWLASSNSFSELPVHHRRMKRLEMQKPADRTWLEDPCVSEEDGELGVVCFALDDYGYDAFLERLAHLSRDRDCWKRWKKAVISAATLLMSSMSQSRSPSYEREEVLM